MGNPVAEWSNTHNISAKIDKKGILIASLYNKCPKVYCTALLVICLINNG